MPIVNLLRACTVALTRHQVVHVPAGESEQPVEVSKHPFLQHFLSDVDKAVSASESAEEPETDANVELLAQARIDLANAHDARIDAQRQLADLQASLTQEASEHQRTRDQLAEMAVKVTTLEADLAAATAPPATGAAETDSADAAAKGKAGKAK